MEQKRTIESITSSLHEVEGVRCLSLSGSHANGLADEYSDLDFLAIFRPGSEGDISKLWHAIVRHVT